MGCWFQHGQLSPCTGGEQVLARRVDLTETEQSVLLQISDETKACLDLDGNVRHRWILESIGRMLAETMEGIAKSRGLDRAKCTVAIDPKVRSAHVQYPVEEVEHGQRQPTAPSS
jgi:hypothetical protein